MTKYKTVLSKNGRRMYYVDGKLTAQDNISAEIQSRLVDGEELDSTELQGEPQGQEKPKARNACAVCGEPGIKSRAKDGKIYRVCDEHHRLEYLKELG